MADTFTFKKNHLLVVAAIVVIGIFGAISVMANSNNEGPTGNVVKDVIAKSGDYQTVKLSFVNYEYKLEPSTLKQNVPVRMEVDMATVYGCMRDVRIPSFGVSARVSESNNIIEFTPDKSGTFNIACSMNMGRGTFQVAENGGKVANYEEPESALGPASGGSCGAGSGGCGCGGA